MTVAKETALFHFAFTIAYKERDIFFVKEFFHYSNKEISV